MNKTLIKLNKIKSKLKNINLGYDYNKERIYPGEFLSEKQMKTIVDNLNNNKDWNDYLKVKSELITLGSFYAGDVETHDGVEYLNPKIVTKFPDGVNTGWNIMKGSQVIISIDSKLNVEIETIQPHQVKKRNARENILAGNTHTSMQGSLNLNTLEIEDLEPLTG